MRIGGIAGYSSYLGIGSNYRISSIYGNPKSLEAVEKIGEENYTGNPLALVNKEEGPENPVFPARNSEELIDYEELAAQMMQGSRFLTEPLTQMPQQDHPLDSFTPVQMQRAIDAYAMA